MHRQWQPVQPSKWQAVNQLQNFHHFLFMICSDLSLGEGTAGQSIKSTPKSITCNMLHGDDNYAAACTTS